MEEVTVDDVLSVTNVFSDLVMLFVVLDVVAIFIMLFLEKYDPRVFVTWLILLIFLPPVGFILYLYMGATFYNRHRFTPKNITDTQMMRAYQWQRGRIEEDYAAHPDREDIFHMAKSLENAGAWPYSANNDITLYT